MKKMSKSYRMQIIKEVAERKVREQCNDPMAQYINSLLDQHPERDNIVEFKQEFTGNYFDENAGGWVSKTWRSK
ncbi:hypothetical protein [Vibrio methylphosphonaticus]|uniref:hypothetical protein n=1 Tax=Vibrio methylphosphonaticus TaxID=2946866 RepID=UPI00202AA499|nr:hypothetical protein [Vibrio methylphosphonaticus]MCL9774870.1 hypothetical protein [Vibrio methylphosphonaticus]